MSTIKFHEYLEIDKETVTLEDLIKQSEVNIPQLWKSVEIIQDLDVNETKFIPINLIKKRLFNEFGIGVDSRLFSHNENIVIHRPLINNKLVDISKNIEGDLSDYLAKKCESFTVKPRTLLEKQMVMQGATYKIEKRLFDKTLKKIMPVWINEYQQHKLVRRKLTEWEVVCLAKVWQAIQPIAIGELITPQKCQLIQIDIAGLYFEPVFEEPYFVAKRFLPGNSILHEKDMKMPPLIKKNKTLQLIVSQGSVRLNMEVIAMQEGLLGERILVKLDENKPLIRAKVISEEIVAVE